MAETAGDAPCPCGNGREFKPRCIGTDRAPHNGPDRQQAGALFQRRAERAPEWIAELGSAGDEFEGVDAGVARTGTS
jgi:hypothetical protein